MKHEGWMRRTELIVGVVAALILALGLGNLTSLTGHDGEPATHPTRAGGFVTDLLAQLFALPASSSEV